MSPGDGSGGMSPCDGCGKHAFMLRMIDGGKLCDTCVEKSRRIDQLLVGVGANDPVACDNCGDRVDFDAKVAIITRECGGTVLCDDCLPDTTTNERAVA